jgi:hypothetical protein
MHDVAYLTDRADAHRTRVAVRHKDALLEYGRRSGRDAESRRVRREITGVRTPG